MRHGARILASKWREGVTPNGCRPFFENGEVPLPLPTSRAALVFCRQHGLLIDVSSAQRAMPIDFFRSDRPSLGWDCSSTGLRHASVANFCHSLAKSIFGWWTQRSPPYTSQATPPYSDALLIRNANRANWQLVVESFSSSHPKDGHRQWPSGIEARLPALSPASPVSLGASFISLAIGGKLDGDDGSSMADDEQHLDLFPLPARMGEELGAGQ